MSTLPTYALSIRQPWAWAIFQAGKDIENRSWETLRRGPICIHVGMKSADRAEVFAFREFLRTIGINPPNMDALPHGGILGTAEIADCVIESRSPWFFGKFGIVLANVQPVPFIPCKGKLGFFAWQRDGGMLL